MEKSQVIQVTLEKYDNQAEQYKPFMSIESNREEIMLMLVKNRFRQPVLTFYVYKFRLDDLDYHIYSVSPALFDNLQLVST